MEVPTIILRLFPCHLMTSNIRDFRLTSKLIACALLGCLSEPFHRDAILNGTPDSSRSLSGTSVDQVMASSYCLPLSFKFNASFFSEYPKCIPPGH
ncbi:hypothetical protein F5Y11DRAFT_145884 [Daldinia sp. FL1419]|nr:hypothetical protein F5Y11DRAFT_145884 [Daldinia sp. FL1419]